MKYKLIKQEPHCCVPRCLQMIFERHNIIYDSQFKIAEELGLIIDKKYKGTQVQKEEYSINNYLKRHNIPLTFDYFYIVDYNSAKKFINDNIDNDITVCYKRGVMFGKKLDGGHATLIEKIDGDIVTLIYPEDEAGYRNVNVNDLIKAIELHGTHNMAGFWLFKKK